MLLTLACKRAAMGRSKVQPADVIALPIAFWADWISANTPVTASLIVGKFFLSYVEYCSYSD
jgi:hypothetical protein